MPVERRNAPRLPITKNVVLMCRDIGLIRGKTRDISLRGTFVETGRVSVSADIAIGVCFVIKQPQKNAYHTIEAHVIRVTNEGVALIFLETPHEVLDTWEIPYDHT